MANMVHGLRMVIAVQHVEEDLIQEQEKVIPLHQ